jgi:anti-sigma-K factor RskA
VWADIASELGISESASVTSLDAVRRRRTGRWTLLVAAAAVVGIALGSLITVGALRSAPAPQVVAEGSLAAVDDSGLRGTAAVQSVDGHSVLVVSVPELPSAGTGYYEVWMATPDTSTMVAMGTLNPGQEGRFPLPAGMDPKAFPVVDVSVEQFDGDSGHSATSLVRGRLAT